MDKRESLLKQRDEAIKAFLVDLSYLPGATEAAEKAQESAPTN